MISVYTLHDKLLCARAGALCLRISSTTGPLLQQRIQREDKANMAVMGRPVPPPYSEHIAILVQMGRLSMSAP